MARHPFVTVDTEFLRETTYYPLLCVAQMASPDEAVVVDALAAGIDLGAVVRPDDRREGGEGVPRRAPGHRNRLEHGEENPASDLRHPGRRHGARLWRFDLLRPTGAAHHRRQLDKSHRFTDWTRRPLSDAQVTYALSDVTHLRDVYLKLAADLAKRERTSWVEAEMDVLTSPETYRMEPERAWERLKSRVRKPKELAVLIEVAAWREREAQTRDVPRSRVLKDDVLGDIAMQAPTTIERLGHLRSLPKGFERSRWGEAIVEAVKRGLERDPKTLPRLERFRPAPNGAATVELLKVLLRMTAESHGVAAKVIATVDELDRIAADDDADVPALKGLAARIVRRQGARAQARQAGARGRKRPRRGGGQKLALRGPRSAPPRRVARAIEQLGIS